MKPDESIILKDSVCIRVEQTKNIRGPVMDLSSVRKITDIYKGKTEVESVPDQGSFFRVILPRVENP